ncbi:YgjP-like metallopeptidase domain-containing protein [Actinomadura sp. NPDC048955]|uniref:YgjP-like metallopeptidase domain-containing protein n=1 Tax=Actinomadura sp. NPDC048955 TaxID=3158228 RepID=UPI0033F877B3
MDITHLREGSRLRSPDGRDFTLSTSAQRHGRFGWWAVPDRGGRRTFLTQPDLTPRGGWTILDSFRIIPYGAADIPHELVDALTDAVPAGIEWIGTLSTRRRTVGLTVDEHARLHVTAPATMPAAQVAAQVAENTSWIWRHVRRPGHNGPPTPAGQNIKEMVAGENLPWLGRPARLDVVDDPSAPPARRTRNGFGNWVVVRADLTDRQRADAVIHLDRAHGRQFLAEHCLGLLDRAGVARAPRWEVTELPLSRRWATYYPRTHTVRVHWPLLQLDVTIIEYAVARALWQAENPDRRVSLYVWHPGAADAARRLGEAGRTVWDGSIRRPRSSA